MTHSAAVLLVGNGRLVTRDSRNTLIEDGCVAIRAGMVAETGATEALRAAHPHAQFIDARGGLIMPGLVNAHTHLYSSFARGMALDSKPPAHFVEILERLWWRLDRALTIDDIYLSAMVAMIDCVRNGVTTIFDHHSSPGAVRGSLFRIAEAACQAGLRSCLCYEVTDREGEAVTAEAIEENRAFLEHCRQTPDSLLRALFGLHASFTLSDETLIRCGRIAADLGAGFHIHAAEGAADAESCRREHGMRVVERLHALGILGPRTIAAHCIHIDEREIDLLASTRTAVVHNPESNMGNAVGCAPVLEMVARGVRVGLGTDAYTADMLESMKVANLLQKHHAASPSVAWVEPPAMLFHRNAEFASDCFGAPIGRLVPGACADLIVVDYDPPTPLTSDNVDGHLLFGTAGRSVRTTVIAGKVVMQDRELPGLDEARILAEARAAASRLWQRI